MTPPAEQVHPEQGVQPVARLSLASHLGLTYRAGQQRMVREYQHRAGLVFVYAGASVHGRRDGEPVRLPQADGERLIARQPQAEQALRQRLRELGLSPALRQSQALPNDSAEMFQAASEEGWLQFVQHGLPELRREGWRIEIQPGFLYDFSPVDDWYLDIRHGDGEPNHIELELGIVIDGHRHSLLPLLVRLLRQAPELLNSRSHKTRGGLRVRLESGANVILPFARLNAILGTLGELYLPDQPGGNSLRLHRLDLSRLAQLGQNGLRWQGDRQLPAAAAPATAGVSPSGLKASLRPYQLQGLAWMTHLRELGACGILGDDMGLGKTLQSLAYLLQEKQAGRQRQPALAIMPTSLIPNWQDEAARFTPQLRVLALHGGNRHRHRQELAEYDLLLSTYALLPRDIDYLREQPLHLLIFDEAQNLKNPRSKAALAAQQLQAGQRLCLSGTPVENHLGELWSLFHILMPGWLGDLRAFTRNYRTPIEKQGDRLRLEQLRQRIAPFLLRRRKEDVARELPAKTEIVHWVELNEAQREYYEWVREEMQHKVRAQIERNGLARSQIVILDALLRLRQACCDLRLLKPARPLRGSSSAKLDSLLEMLDELLAEGHRVLLFSQFTSMLELVEQALHKRGIDYLMLTGATQDRRTPVERFQAGEVPLFLISLKAGGTGLNLTAADTVIHYDPWWNPAAENQASDRAYRIGQDKPVFIYRLITRGTVEERIRQMQLEKSRLAQELLGSDSEGNWALDEREVDSLFAPLPKPGT
ncbi:DEAD/DEAH box helicase [Stutzerimonas kirkiae]|uniref:Helicase n=1 Tax=Stutzerimonas kirkiae TaxID=2211392 RepID=A0A4Q9RB36_9GAMM|nr:DEAD/DEAH box helicase [Stutzerimonas kirkiae]TBU97394.1 helicase [Stutzerimonas kirkiae]TBV00370.1 helicase [Stutzerimonas kirkiae]TBV05504.1 helicase [Stutzerimonas kirkiae]TBV10550.1 helicase [Stutzerimonas kirkiae]